MTNLRDKARFVHFELGGGGIWQRAAATVRRIDEEVRDPQADKPLKIEVAQGANDPLTTIFEYTRMSAPSLMPKRAPTLRHRRSGSIRGRGMNNNVPTATRIAGFRSTFRNA